MEKVTRGLLDTSVVIAHTEEHLGTPLPEQAAISVATLAELHHGLLVTSDPTMRNRRIQRLVLVEALFDPLPLDAEVGRAFATVAHAVKTAGGQPRARVMDLWIAATALAYELPLYTRNFEDFKLLQDLVELRAI